jgi:hypothetical protein
MESQKNYFDCLAFSVNFSNCQFGVRLFIAIFYTILVISWWSVLLVGETEVFGENHQPATSH